MSLWDWCALSSGSLALGALGYWGWWHRRYPFHLRGRPRHAIPAEVAAELPRPLPLPPGLPLVALGALVACCTSLYQTCTPRLEPIAALPSMTVASKEGPGLSAQEIALLIDRLRPLHRPMGKLQPGDWLAHHKEAGQSFIQYLQSNPVGSTRQRTTIYLAPIGPLTVAEWQIFKETARFLSIYYCLPVTITRTIPLAGMPRTARRWRSSGVEQLDSTYLLNRALRPRLPDDAACLLGITARDLWPGKRGWNFVYGMASTRERVGVFSIHRNGHPETDRTRCLLRTLKTSSHEVGHMFALLHCTRYECNMCGANNRSEADRRPITLCPECLGKVLWAHRCDPLLRFQELAEFFHRNGMAEQRLRFMKLAESLQGEPRPSRASR